MKANPAPEVLRLLATLGSSFDTASVAEIEMALDAGAQPDAISFGNTIKKERDIARAFELGVRLFAVDCVEEVDKVAVPRPCEGFSAGVLTDGEGAEWPLSRKFGCVPEMAVSVLRHAVRTGLSRAWRLLPCRLAADRFDRNGIAPSPTPSGCSPPCGRGHPAQDGPIWAVVFRPLSARRAGCPGLWPGHLRRAQQSISATACRRRFIEPGRGMVGNAGVIKSESWC